MTRLVPKFSKGFIRFTWESTCWSLSKILIQIWNCSHKGFYDCTVFHKTVSSWFLTHGLVKTFLAHAVWWFCKFSWKVIQKYKFSYIKFDKFFLTLHIFDVTLPITLQFNKFLFSGITWTCAQIFTCRDCLWKIPISLYLDYTHLQYLVCNFHENETKFLERFLEFTSDSY